MIVLFLCRRGDRMLLGCRRVPASFWARKRTCLKSPPQLYASQPGTLAPVAGCTIDLIKLYSVVSSHLGAMQPRGSTQEHARHSARARHSAGARHSARARHGAGARQSAMARNSAVLQRTIQPQLCNVSIRKFEPLSTIHALNVGEFQSWRNAAPGPNTAPGPDTTPGRDAAPRPNAALGPNTAPGPGTAPGRHSAWA